MDTHTYLDRSALERSDFSELCFFSGAAVLQSTSEHLIPRWMLTRYDLHHRRVQMGSTSAVAHVREFKVTAELENNQLFGTIENKVRNGEADLDEIHLWHKKISAGITLAHWRLSKNTFNPRAPDALEEAILPMMLGEFQKDFRVFRSGAYSRTGSTICMPSPIADGWVAHVVGSIRKEEMKHFHHLPYALMGTSVMGKLHISLIHDSGRDLEAEYSNDSLASDLATCKCALDVQYVLALALTKVLVRWHGAFSRQTSPQSVFESVAYQLGFVFDGDGELRPR